MTEMPETKRKNGKTIVIAVVIVVVLFASLYVFYDFNGKSFDVSDRQVLLIVTDSMDGDSTEYEIDSFPRDTFVMVKHLSEEEKMQIQVGDVLSFWYNGILDHHRVIESHLEEGYVITEGDSPNVHATENVTLPNINGKVIGTNVWLGHVVSFVKDNFLIVIAIIAIFAIAGEIYRAYRNGVFSKEE